MAIPFRTRSGRWLDLEQPQACDIDVNDIASGLSKACRFAGQIDQFYSVAQHALFVTELVDAPFQFRAVNHDDTEAYLGDLSRYLKHSSYLQGYRFLEARLDACIHEALGLLAPSAAEKQAIKDADDLAAVYEQVVLRLKLPFTEELLVDHVASGFVRGPVDRLLELVPRLFDRVDPWILPRANPLVRLDMEHEFLNTFNRLARDRS